MRKSHFASFVLAKPTLAAAAIICQAVFLLLFGAPAQAVTAGGTALQVEPVTVTGYAGKKVFKVKVNMTASVKFEIFKYETTLAASPAYTVDGHLVETEPLFSQGEWLLSPNIPAGVYKVRAVAQVVGGDAAYGAFSGFSVEPMTTTSLALTWLKPQETTVGGSVTVAASSSLSGINLNFAYRALADTAETQIGQALADASGSASVNWNTAGLADGEYVLSAKAESPLAVAIKKTVTVKNAVTTTTLPLKVAFLTTNPTLTTGSKVRFYARPNQAVDEVQFFLTGPDKEAAFASSLGDNNSYYFDWNPQDGWPFGSYRVSVIATIKTDGNDIFSSDFWTVDYPAPAVSAPVAATTTAPTEPLPPTPTTTPTTTTAVISKVETVMPGLVNGVASGWVKLVAKASTNIKRVQFVLSKDGRTDVLGEATFNTLAAAWQLGWQSTGRLDGAYSLKAVGYDNEGMAVSGNSISFILKNQLVSAEPEVTTQATTTTTTKTVTATTTAVKTETAVPLAPTTLAPAPAPQPATTTREVVVAPAPAAPLAAPSLPAIPEEKAPAPAAAAPQPVETPAPKQAVGTECEQAGIAGTAQCELYLLGKLATRECLAANASSRSACADLVIAKYGQPSICQRLADERCRQIIETIALGDFVPRQAMEAAKKEIESVVGKNITISHDNASSTIRVNDAAAIELSTEKKQRLLAVLPFSQKQSKVAVTVLPAAGILASDSERLPGLLVIDTDGDGLPDDLEARLGTDFNNADSDNDGYADGAEVASGHNPLGRGVLVGELKPIDRAIIGRKPLSQPKYSGEAKADQFKVESVASPADPDRPAGPAMVLKGKALPDQLVTLYIYSALPIVVTVMTDQNGNWQYNFDKQLSEGKHEAFVVLNDDQGRIEAKSAPFSFFINEARAISQDDLLKADINVYNQTDTMIGWYVAAGSVLIFFLIGLYYLYVRGKRNAVLN